MPDKEGRPLPREWWGRDRKPMFFIVGCDTKGRLCLEDSHHLLLFDNPNASWDDLKWFPDCDGWDWEEPEWVPLNPHEYGGHVLRINVDQFVKTGCDDWKPVDSFFMRRIDAFIENRFQFRCQRKDLPKKPDSHKGVTLTLAERDNILVEILGVRRQIESLEKFLLSK